MFESIGNFFKKIVKPENKELGSKDSAKERLHLVLMQDRANVSADFLELMKQEIIDVIKKYIVVDEDAIDVRLTNQENEDGTNGAPSLYANIPIVNIKNDMMAEKIKSFEGVDFNKEINFSCAIMGADCVWTRIVTSLRRPPTSTLFEVMHTGRKTSFGYHRPAFFGKVKQSSPFCQITFVFSSKNLCHCNHCPHP